MKLQGDKIRRHTAVYFKCYIVLFCECANNFRYKHSFSICNSLMVMVNRLLLLALTSLLALAALVSPGLARAEDSANVVVHVFWSEGCPHCAKERAFLNTFASSSPLVSIQEYEITRSRENGELLDRVGRALGADVSGVPFTVVGNRYISGFFNEEITGRQIETLVRQASSEASADIVTSLKLAQENASPIASPNLESSTEETVTVPFFGTVSVGNISLPLLTVAIAFLDGFNPCAMWALLFLIGLLLGMGNRRKMWILGLAFITASGAVYFLFLSAWLNLFLFLGFIVWVRIAIGLFAASMGAYQLNDFWSHRAGVCSLSTGGWRERILHWFKFTVENKGFYVALVGIIALAAVVNLVEFACSAGLPAIYTHVLSLSSLSWWQYYSYLILYIAVFILDDIAVFVGAMFTLRLSGLETKYAKYSKLVGGLLMLAIGLLLLLKPEWLMFG